MHIDAPGDRAGWETLHLAELFEISGRTTGTAVWQTETRLSSSEMPDKRDVYV